MKTITFNSYSLQTSSIVMTGLDFQNIEKNINSGRLATTDINKFIESYVADKQITYTGFIKANTDILAEQKLDELKQNVMLNNVGNLDIEYAGTNRRYKVVCKGIKITNETPSLDIKYISIVFETIEPLGLDLTSTVINYANETSSSISKTISFLGTYPALPKYTVTVNSHVGLTSISILCTNTNQKIELQKLYNNGDIIEVDTRNKIVKWDGVDTDYTGIFPTVLGGSNTLIFQTAGISSNLNISVEYIARYL